MTRNSTLKKIKTKAGKVKSESSPRKKATKQDSVTLPAPFWGMWLAYVLAHGTCWLYDSPWALLGMWLAYVLAHGTCWLYVATAAHSRIVPQDL